MSSPKKILIIQLRQIGDIILTTPIARYLKKSIPGVEISFLSHPMGRLVLEKNPYIDHNHYYDPHKNYKEELLLALKLRSEKFDVVYDFMGNPRSGFYSFMSGAKKRVAFKSSRGFLYTELVPRLKESVYIVKEKFSLLGVAEPEDDDQLLDLAINSEDISYVEPFINALNNREEKPLIVCLSPTHRHAVRRWHDELWVELARYLVKSHGAVILWIWGPKEDTYVNGLKDALECESFLAPKTSFSQLTALFTLTDLFIGTSNGPSHAAVASGVSTLQLHGPTQGPAWCPPRSGHRFVQGGEVIGGDMDKISLLDVIKAFEEILPNLNKNKKFLRI